MDRIRKQEHPSLSPLCTAANCLLFFAQLELLLFLFFFCFGCFLPVADAGGIARVLTSCFPLTSFSGFRGWFSRSIPDAFPPFSPACFCRCLHQNVFSPPDSATVLRASNVSFMSIFPAPYRRPPVFVSSLCFSARFGFILISRPPRAHLSPGETAERPRSRESEV